jgi:hypothetical protein
VSKAQAPTLTQARIADAAVEIVGEQDPGDLAFLHTVLAQCGLPYRDPGTRDYIRENGRASIIVTAGHLFDPKQKRAVLQGIPYGAKPRLLMIHLCTEAIRTQSPKIQIADSMSGFMRELGLKVTGGNKGTIGMFKEQLNRLAASRMQLMMAYESRAVVVNPAPLIKQFDVWFPEDPRQRVLWPSEITLSGEFFDALKDHGLPLDPRGIRALQHSARALDVYTWLTARLPRVKNPNGERVSWRALQSQFGPDLPDYRNFRRQIQIALRQALTVYPKARVEKVEGGLILRRSDPPIARAARARNVTRPKS